MGHAVEAKFGGDGWGSKFLALTQLGENPLATLPASMEVRAALDRLELLVVQDPFMTETARMAHAVLPACTSAEKDGTFTNLEGRVLRVREALDPVGESLPDWHIMTALANALVVHELTAKERNKKAKKAKANQEDALILIRLTGIEMIRTAHGSATSQAMTDQLQKHLGNKLREADGIFQIDDDHLAVLLPRTTKEGAQRVANKVEVLVNSMPFDNPSLREHLSATIGISTTNGASSAEAVLKEARSALSEATEHQSRNLLIH